MAISAGGAVTAISTGASKSARIDSRPESLGVPEPADPPGRPMPPPPLPPPRRPPPPPPPPPPHAAAAPPAPEAAATSAARPPPAAAVLHGIAHLLAGVFALVGVQLEPAGQVGFRVGRGGGRGGAVGRTEPRTKKEGGPQHRQGRECSRKFHVGCP